MAATDNMPSLDEKIREFAATNLEREGVVTGWVLMVATSRFDDDGAMAYAYDYSVGPDCDMVRAVGLVKCSSALMDRHVRGSGGD